MASKFGGMPVTGSRFGGIPVTGSRPVVIPEEEDDRTLGDSVNDFVANFGVGSGQIVGLLGSAYGLATGDMENRLTQTGARTSKFWEERRTPAYLEAERSRQAKIDATEGEFKKAGVAMWETVTNPMLLVGELAKQAPNLALGGVGGSIGKVATASTAKVLGREVSEQGLVRAGTVAATGTGVGLSSADFGQSAYEQLMSLPDEVWLANPQVQERIGDNMDLLPQVKREIATGLAQNSAIAGGLVTYGLNKLPGAKTIEKALGGEALTGTRLRRAAAGLAGETLSEGLEEGATQLTANIAQSQIDPNTRLSTGVGQSAGLGAVTGGGLGLITGALTPDRKAVEDEVLKFGNPPPAPAEVSPEQATTFARTRLEELIAKGKGTAATEIVDPTTGQTVISPGRPAEFLSDNERTELEFLVNNVSNLEAIGTAYNLKVKVAAEQRLNEATSAADAVQAASDMVDTDIEALEREAGIGTTTAPVASAVAPVTTVPEVSTTVPEVSTAAPQGQGLLAQAMAPTLTLETLTQADISTMPAPERQEFLDDLTAARTANLPVQREQALRRAAETYGRTVGPVQQALPSVTPQEAIARAQEDTARAQDLPQERTRTAAPSLDTLMSANTRGMDLQDREDFNANLAMARGAQPGPVQTAALQRAAEVYGRTVGPVQTRAPAAQTTAPRVEVPRPTKLLGKAAELYSETDLETLISNNTVPAITRRGAEVELRARQVPQIQESTTDENFISIPETVSNVAVQPVAGQSAGDAARATAQRAMDTWAASQGTNSPVAFNAASPELEASVAEITDLIGSQWGGRVVAFSDPRPGAINGVAIGKVAYVNVSGNQAGVQRTALHEFKHTVEQIAKAEAAAGMTDTPAQEFVEQIDSVFDDITEEGKRAYLENFIAVDELSALEGDARETRMQELLQDPELRSEMVADFLGNRATDKKFWKDLAKADPTGFESFVKRWLAAIDNLLATLRGAKNRNKTESAKVDTYIRDLNKAKLTAQSALINYRKASGQAPAAPAQDAAAQAAVTPDDLAATSEDVVKAEAFEEKYEILPYTSRGQLEIKFSIKESGKYGDHPLLGIPVNKNGTVSLYFPTTNDTAKVVRRDKALRGETPSSDRIYLTNESSAPKVERFPGLIAQPLGGANVLVQVDPDLVQILTEYPDGRKDFFMPIAEGAAFKAKMTKLFTLNVPRGKGLSPDRTLLEIQKSIATAATTFKEASRGDRKALVSAARKVLRAEHNVGTLLGENGKLEKTRIGDYGLTYDGQSVSSLGLGLASAQKINDKQKLTSCPQSAICEDLCLGETSGQNMLYGGIGQFRSGPRLSQYLKTEAMVLHPEEFTTVLMAEIEAFRLWSAKEDYKPAIRLNVTSDFVPKILEPIITAFPDTMFYDYTKMNTDVIAPNHHLTYSSTGASQVVNGETIINPETNWPRMVQRMRNGQNVAMAFTVRNDMPDFVQDEVSGEQFQVWNGDNYDARFLDPKPGEPGNTFNKGMIIGLTNKDRTGPTDTAAKRHRGFFLEYDRARDGDTLIIKDQNALKETVARPVKMQFSRKQGDVLARDPRLEQAAQGMKEGTVTSAEYGKLVDALKPVTPYTEVPEPAKLADIRRALSSDKHDRIGVPSKTLKAGYPVGLRLDIPAYINHGVWVVSVHEQVSGFAAGKSIGYEGVAAVTNPTFGVEEYAALSIATGKPKGTIAVVKGNWKPMTAKQAFAAAKLAMGSANWVQVGMDPKRHSYFYDRATGEPVLSADEAIQVGPLVFAKNPVYGKKEDFRFSRSQGEAPSRQRGINVRNDGDNLYADLIVDGEKTMESRNTNSLRAYVGQTVGIIRTGEGPARLIGSVKIGEPIEVNEQEFRELEPEHLVPKNSTFDIKPEGTKFLYPLTEAQRFDEESAVDSRGIVARDVAFSRSQTDTPAFKRWFGDSKVVDADGEPLVMYHGSGAEITDAFKPNSWWTDDSQYASRMARQQKNGSASNVTPAYLSLNKIARLKDLRSARETLPLGVPDNEVFKVLSDAGFDGLSTMGGTKEIIVFNPNKIKSAISNSGAFDPTNPDVRFSRSQTDTPAFKRWFGDSKVVDTDGEPLVVYHGTASDFDVFKRTRIGEFGPAIYTTDNAGEAFQYAVSAGSRDIEQAPLNTMPVYVSLQNPYTEGVEAYWKRFGKDNDGNPVSDAATQENAIAAGFDGVIVKRIDSRNKTLTHYIAFRPEQVKSATGNTGAFDPAIPDVRFSRSQTDTPAFKRWFGDSKVVDDQGRPLVVYHGSTVKGVTEFDTSRVTARNAKGDVPGTYFTAGLDAAYQYTRSPGSKAGSPRGDVTAAYLRIENPLKTTAAIKKYRKQGLSFGDAKRKALEALTPEHDGIIFDGDNLNTPEYVVFEPTQIKSATGNTGAFDPAIPDVRFSPAQPTRDWVKDSVVVTPSGQPLVVYHGSRKTFSTFDNTLARDGAHFFTPNKEHASFFGPARGYVLSIKNPLVINQEDLEDRVTEEEADEGVVLPRDYIAEFVEEAKKAGRDGLVIENFADMDFEETVYLPFAPDSIRENESEPDVRFSRSQKSPLKLYSALARAAEAGPGKGQAQQWKGFLRNQKGVTPEEIEWSGVEDWLDTQTGAITREQVTTFLAENGVQVGEVVLGNSGEVYPDDFWRSPYNGNEMSYDDWVQELKESGEDPDEAFGNELIPIGGAPRAIAGDAKYGKYTVPGGENYREILLTLPTDFVPGNAGEITFSDEDSVDDFLTTLSAEGFESLDYGGIEDEAGNRKVVVFEGLTQAERARFDSLAREYGGTVKHTDGSTPAPLYRHSHWEQGNVLAHIRLKDRLDDEGNEVLFVEELQSDWGKEGREKGFLKGDLLDQPMVAKIARDEYGNPYWRVTTDSGILVKNLYGVRTLEGLEEEAIASAKDYVRMEGGSAIARPAPAAPFVQTTGGWLNLALKRVIAIAVEQGYDKVAFVNGEQSAKHYDLAQEVSSIELESPLSSLPGEDFSTGYLTVRDLEGYEILDVGGMVSSPEQIAERVGKEVAQKLLDAEPRNVTGRIRRKSLTGEGLSVGGEGMKAFYDFIVPKTLNKLLPKIGGTKIETVETNLPILNPRPYKSGYEIMTEMGIPYEEQDAYWGGLGRRETDRLFEANRAKESFKKMSSMGFSITPEMRDQVMDAGLPMFSRAQNIFGKPLPATAWQVKQGRLDDIIYRLQDKLVDTKRVVESINEAVGQIADKWDPYLQETLYHGKVSTKTKDFAEIELKSLIEAMGRYNVSIEDFDQYLHNRHAPERNAAIAKINSALPDAGSGIATADAQAYMAALPAARRAALEGLARKIDAITAGTRRVLLDAGLENQDTIDAWEGAYGKYVPLMREEIDFDFSGQGAGTGQGVSVSGSASKRATGSATRKVVDILANVVMQRERAIVRAEKNRVSQALYGLSLKNPSPSFWLPINPDGIKNPQALAAELVGMGINPIEANNIAQEPRQTYPDPRTGLVTSRVNPFLRSSANVIATRVNGKDRYLILNPQNPQAERMALSLKNLDVDQLGREMSIASKGTRWFASVNTQYNPIFGVINFTRDVQGGLLNLSTTPIANKKTQVLANTLPALNGIYRDLRTGAGTGQWAQLWEEFQGAGGQTGFRDQFSQSTERTEALEKELKALTNGTAKKAGRAVLDWLSDYNTAMENAVRLSAYKVGLDNGMSKDRAAAMAKNLTVNFNKKGQIATQAGALYAFFNAAVQGTARLAETLTGPAGKKIMYGGLLLGSAQALMMAAAGFGEDEPPKFIRERNIVIPIGGGDYIAIPMPLGFNVIPNTSRIATEWALSGFERTPDRAIEMATSFFDMFNPIGNAGWSGQTIAPTLADPFVALWENRDWTGNPIAREDLNSLDPTPGYLRGRDTASWFSNQLSYYLNLASGGTDFAPGGVSPTPDQLDYLIGQVTGGVGRESMKVEQTISALATGQDLPPYQIPLAGRMYGKTTGSAAEASAFYDNIREMNVHNNELQGRRLRREPTGEYLRENPDARLATQASRVYRQVQDLRKRKREMVERGASRESVKIIEQQITNRMQQFNDRVSRIES